MKQILLVLAFLGLRSAVSDDLPLTCDEDKVYQESNNCGRTCPDSSQGSCYDPIRWDCFCKSNTFLQSDGRCVDISECNQMQTNPGSGASMTCDGGMEWLSSDPNCGYKCIDYSNNIVDQCNMPSSPGCYCPSGLYLSASGRCLTPSECDDEMSQSYYNNNNNNNNPPVNLPECPGGQLYFSCDPSCGKTCDNFSDSEPEDCSQDCTSGCYCMNGQYRNDDGQCINCPQQTQGEDSSFDENDGFI